MRSSPSFIQDKTRYYNLLWDHLTVSRRSICLTIGPRQWIYYFATRELIRCGTWDAM